MSFGWCSAAESVCALFRTWWMMRRTLRWVATCDLMVKFLIIKSNLWHFVLWCGCGHHENASMKAAATNDLATQKLCRVYFEYKKKKIRHWAKIAIVFIFSIEFDKFNAAPLYIPYIWHFICGRIFAPHTAAAGWRVQYNWFNWRETRAKDTTAIYSWGIAQIVCVRALRSRFINAGDG